MKNIEKYRNLIAKGEVDALLLTSKHNRMYAAEYCVAEGVSVICKEESYYFTDFRYIEAAQKNLPGFTVVMTDADHPYTKLINDAIAAHTVKTLGFEDDSLTVEEYTLYNTKLNAVLHPYSAEINAPRQSKEPWEIEYMKKAQEITDRVLSSMHVGITLLDGEGAYMKTPKKVILCVARKHSFPKVRDVVKEIDPHAFVIVSSATEIFGKGYKSQFTDEM